MGRAPCCEKVGLKKGPWTPQEDQKLIDYVKEHGHGSWRSLPKKAGLLRCGKSCRLRWANYLRPDIKRGEFSLGEEQLIIQLHGLLGNRWSSIATHLPKRTDNEIKNYWNTHLKKRLMKMGVDPVTHKPMPMEPIPMSASLGSLSLSHEQQWESARIEGEARLAAASSLCLDKSPLWPEAGRFAKMPNLDLAISDSQCSSPSSIIPELFSSSTTTCNYDTSIIQPTLTLPLEQDQITTLDSCYPLSSSSSDSSNYSNNVDLLANLVEMKEDTSIEDDFIIPEYSDLKTIEDWTIPLGHELTDFQLLQMIDEAEQCALF